MAKNRLVLIDGHSVVFRAFYAIPYLTAPDGEMVNAVYGFASILLNVIEKLEPTHVAVAFDVSAPTFRHTDFAGYKAQRKETPSELKDQMGRVREVVEALNMPIFEVEGYEADDVIGTLARQASKRQSSKASKLETVIVTGDQDAFQLVDDGKVMVWVPGRRSKPDKMYDSEEVVKKVGVRPEQVVDLKGLMGDSSDNIPGVKGIGPKTARRVLLEFGTIDNLYRYLVGGSDDDEEIPKTKSQVSNKFKIQNSNIKTNEDERLERAGVKGAVLKKLVEGYEMAVKSKGLATIITEVPIQLDLGACEIHGYNKDDVLGLFEELGFKSLMGKLPQDQFEMDVQEALF